MTDSVLGTFAASMPTLGGSALGAEDPTTHWAADVAVLYAVYAAKFFTEDAPGSRFKKKDPWRIEIRGLFYAYMVHDVAERHEAPSLLMEPTAKTIERALLDYSQAAVGLFKMDRSDTASAAIRFSGAVVDACTRAGLTKVGDPITVAPSLFGAIGGANAFVRTLLEQGLIESPHGPISDSIEAEEERPDDWSDDLPSIRGLTGDALGYLGDEQLKADLCLGFGLALRSFLIDQGWDISDEDTGCIVAAAGFLAAAPVVAAEFGVDVLNDEGRWQRARDGLEECGMLGYGLSEHLDAGDMHGYLGAIAAATKSALHERGVDVTDEMAFSLPTRLAAAAAFVEVAAQRPTFQDDTAG